MLSKLREYIHGYIWREVYISPRKQHKKTISAFIDNILIIWTGTLEQLLEFKQRINKVHPSIKFNLKFWNKKINILDTVVYKTAIGKYETKLYTKDTDRQVRVFAPTRLRALPIINTRLTRLCACALYQLLIHACAPTRLTSLRACAP